MTITESLFKNFLEKIEQQGWDLETVEKNIKTIDIDGYEVSISKFYDSHWQLKRFEIALLQHGEIMLIEGYSTTALKLIKEGIKNNKAGN